MNFTSPSPENRTPHPLENPPVQKPVQQVEEIQLFRPQIRFDRNQVRLTYILIALNVIVFIIDYFSGSMLTLWGMKENTAILSGQYWRLLTPVFLHGGILHLVFNNYFLYVMGPRVEESFGLLRFASIYFLSSISGVLLSLLLSERPAIGASGALFGLLGAMIPYLYINRKTLRNSRQLLNAILQTIGINLLIGLSPGIDNWAHLGGLLGGLLLSSLITPRYILRWKTDGTIAVDDKMDMKVITFEIIGFVVIEILAFILVLALRGRIA